jgi:CheY-like chemotaxis protein
MKAENRNLKSEIRSNKALSRSRILVMDDEYIVRRLLYRMLHESGYDVTLAASGTEAIDLYVKAASSGIPFDAVIIDLIVQDDIGGQELITKLKEINPQVKAIVSSGYVNESAMPALREFGFSAMVAKPFTIENMLGTLRDILYMRNQ